MADIVRQKRRPAGFLTVWLGDFLVENTCGFDGRGGLF